MIVSEYLGLKGLNYAYRNEHAKAEKDFEQLLAQAPQIILVIKKI